MNKELRALCDSLETRITTAYAEAGGVTLTESEMFASEFLTAQMQLAKGIRNADLDARMRKKGLKAIRATVYNEIVEKSERRPTVDAMEHMLNLDTIVGTAQEEFDIAETDRNELERYYDIAREGHIFFRTVSKGGFGL